MRTLRFVSLVFLILIFSFLTFSYAGVPQMINYQGKITTPAGALIDTTVQMTFTIYDDSTSGNVLWADTVGSVAVEKGIFSVLLGSVNPIPDSVFDGNVRYLGLKVGMDAEMTPRKAMVSVAYAFRAGTADGGTGGGWVDDGTVVRLETQTDSVGIGTTTPGYKLHLQGNSTAPSPLAYVDQTGTGRGLWVNTVGGACALVAEAGNHGLRVIDAGGDGIHVENAGGWAGYFNGKAYFGDSVGIGTTSPSGKLEVAGSVKMTGFNMPTGCGMGKVLTSDASGAGTWQAAAGGADADWSFRITDTADTTLMTGGAWGIARYGNTLYGNGDSTHVNLGAACTTGTSGQNYKYCTIGGGHGNTASGYRATVAGGFFNTASNSQATVGGGASDTASGNYSTVPGGRSNKAAGDYSFAAGRRAKAEHAGSFVWADNTNEDFASTGDNQFLIRASGNVGIGTTNPTEKLDVAGKIHSSSGGFRFPDGTVQTTAAVGGGGWSDDGTVVRLQTVTDSVGIGTTTPTERLDVSGNIKASGTITSGSSITIDGSNDKITATGGTIDFDDENIVTTGKATIGPGNVNTGTDAFVAGATNTASGSYSSIGGGNNNEAGSLGSTVAGGLGNYASGSTSTIGGGNNNTASGYGSTVGGGISNTASGDSATVGGGGGNVADGPNAVVGGGWSNVASQRRATVGGGYADTANGAYATIGGGYINRARNDYSTIGGGRSNQTNNDYATVGGGRGNNASGYFSTISGGYGNDATDYHASVGGGTGNTASNEEATIGGGRGNSVSGYRATVGGGYDNIASGPYATVAGGDQNSASDSSASVGGGSADTASGIYSTIGGGYGNSAAGQHATIPGGRYNTAAGDFSLAAGRSVNVDASADYTFGFGRSFTTSTPNAVIFFNSFNAIRVGIQVTNPTHYIDVAGGAYCSGTQWVDVSSKKFKKEIRSLRPEEYQEILEKLTQTDVVRFRYKTDDAKLHIGIIAEEAPEEIVDAERIGIPTGDAIGFLLAALKAQQKEIDALKAKLEEIESKH